MSRGENLVEEILAELRASIDGGAWHGPALGEALAGLGAEQAVWRPVAGAHTILEIVLHAAAWIMEVASRVAGNPPAMPAPGDWPTADTGRGLEEGWEGAKVELARSRAALLAALADFPPARLAERVGGERDAPLGTGVSFAGMLHGLAQHNAYHAGQIVLLKKALAEANLR